MSSEASASRFSFDEQAARRSGIWILAIAAVVLGAAFGVGALNPLVPGLATNEGLYVRIAVVAITLLVASAFALGSLFGDAYAGAMWLAGPRIPGIAVLGIVLVYLAPAELHVDRVAAVGIGTYLAGVLWLIFGVAFRFTARANTAHPRPYGDLVERIAELRDRASGLESSAGINHGEIKEVIGQLDRASGLLHQSVAPLVPRAGIGWAAGTAYFVVWRAVHAAEEALLEFGSEDAVIGEALHDDLRLSNSTIDNSMVLRRALRNAVVEIDPEAPTRYFPNLEGVPDAKPRPKRRAQSPRTALREVRYAINEYRDTTRDGLAQARNRLLRTILVAGVVAYLLVAIAILAGVNPHNLQSAAAFFLVGALVGLFNRLRIEASSNRAIDDFGLFEARLLHTPLISGLAAVGGVFLIAIAPLATGIMAESAGATALPKMTEVFDVAENQIGLLVAALFGLTPNSIIGSLQTQTDRLKHDLTMSSAVSSDDRRPLATS
jgi:hypothetical protein